MPTYAYDPSPELLMSGKVHYAIIIRNGLYIAWSRTCEASPSPEYIGAMSRLKDMLHADGYQRVTRYKEKE
jgi:hypothetical protein